MAAVTKITSPEVFYQLGLLSLSQGNLSAFEKENKEDASIIKIRILEHLKIKQLMAENKFSQAMILINNLRLQLGEHISLYCDLASIAYALGNYSVWNQTVTEIQNILPEIKLKLSPDSLTRTQLLLAKFFEEQGLIYKSYDTLVDAVDLAPTILKPRVQANLVRLLSLHQISNDLTTYYKELKQFASGEFEFNTYPEILHSLALAEAKLFGPETLSNAVFKTHSLEQMDKSLVIYDLVQLSILSKYKFPQGLILPHPSNFYERCLNKVIDNNLESNEWLEWASLMPLGNYFVLCKPLSNTLDSNQKPVFQKQLNLLLKSLPLVEQRYWQGLINIASNEVIKYNIDENLRTFCTDGININLKQKKILFTLLKTTIETPKISLENATRKLFFCEYNESYYHRLRRLVKRLNDEFNKQGLPQPLSIEAEHILLSSTYK